jgi:hypothetical protein
MMLNGSVLHTLYNMMRPGQSVRYFGMFFKDGTVDMRLQYETLLSGIKQRVDSWKE